MLMLVIHYLLINCISELLNSCGMTDSCCGGGGGEEVGHASAVDAGAGLELNQEVKPCCQMEVYAVVAAIVVIVLSRFFGRQKKHTKPLPHTLRLLKETDDHEPDVAAICSAFLAMPTIYNEAECAEQMRQLVKGKYLLYKTLETNPEHLLRATRHLSVNDHGGLGTRYTVQYNLFAGSVVAMGTDAQREFLYSTQGKGELGCFAFTELGAGVLSGAGVETTAVYDPEKKEFCIHSPCPSATKTWISQVFTSSID